MTGRQSGSQVRREQAENRLRDERDREETKAPLPEKYAARACYLAPAWTGSA